MKAKSNRIEQQIVELRTKLLAQKRKESDALEAEMLRVVRKAGCQREVIELAQRLLAEKRVGRADS